MSRAKWRYFMHSGNLTQGVLDRLGGDGWELVAVNQIGGETVSYFKQPFPNLREAITLEQRERYFAEWGVEAETPS
jgi:hypothetical protein